MKLKSFFILIILFGCFSGKDKEMIFLPSLKEKGQKVVLVTHLKTEDVNFNEMEKPLSPSIASYYYDKKVQFKSKSDSSLIELKINSDLIQDLFPLENDQIYHLSLDSDEKIVTSITIGNETKTAP